MNRGLAFTVTLRCRDPQFRKWLKVEDETAAVEKVRRICKVTSRRELDTDPSAAQRYDRLIGLPFSSYMSDPSTPYCPE